MEKKDILCSALGAIGSMLTFLFGGWDTAIVTLVSFMAIDYITGLIVAAVFKKSPKTETGALQSKVGYQGLSRKAMTLFFVFIAVRLDLTIGTSYIRDGVCIAFITNELISIVENADLMGLPIPKPIKKAIGLLKKDDEETDKEQKDA